MIQYLVQQDSAALHISNNDGALPIHLACQSGASLQAIQYLVEENGGAGTLLCKCGFNGNLPIHFACHRDFAHFEVIQYLVQQESAMLHIPNNIGALPIHLVCQTDASLLVLKYLVEQDPDSVRTRDGNGNLPIHITCRHRNYRHATIRFLVQQDSATLQISNNAGALPIHLATQYHASLLSIKYLVEEDGGAASLCARDRNGALPLHILCGRLEPQLKMVELLVKAHPAALSTRNRNGSLPLHVLCGCRFAQPSLKVVECLIKPYPAALSTRTSSGDLPVTLACESASLSVIYTLIRGNPEVVPY